MFKAGFITKMRRDDEQLLVTVRYWNPCTNAWVEQELGPYGEFLTIAELQAIGELANIDTTGVKDQLQLNALIQGFIYNTEVLPIPPLPTVRLSTLNPERVVSSGSTVSDWIADIGDGALFQPDGLLQPILEVNQQNGHPLIRFDGINDFLRGNSFFANLTKGKAAITIIIAGRVNAIPAADGAILYFSTGINSNDRIGFYVRNNGGKSLKARSADLQNTSNFFTQKNYAAGQFEIFTLRINFAEGKADFRLNGLPIKEPTVIPNMVQQNTPDTTPVICGIGSRNGGSPVDYSIGEIQVFDTYLSDQLCLDAERNMGATWAISIKKPFVIPANYNLTFEDNFQGVALNTDNWRTDYWFGPTSEGNNELQLYKPENCVLEGDDVLRLRALKPEVSEMYNGKEYPYTSGLINSYGKRVFKYGVFECRAKLPKGKGFWPAFWLLPGDQSWPPEIDIFENVGHEINKLYFTKHWKDAGGVHRSVADDYVGPDYSLGFHLYQLHWTSTFMRWYVDGNLRFERTDNLPNVHLYILANLAVGGTWPGSPDVNTPFPSEMQVDYIRVYQHV